MKLVQRFLFAGTSFRIFAIFGFIAPLVTFLIALSTFTSTTKIILLALIALLYTALFFFTINKQSKNNGPDLQKGSETFAYVPPDQFAALDDANNFFGASLNRGDMFRLVTARVNEIFPLDAAVFFVPDAETDSLKAVELFGETSDEIVSNEADSETGLAGMAFVSGEIELSPRLDNGQTSGIRSSAAIPLVYEGRVIAIYELFTDRESADPLVAIETLRSLQDRITPLFLGSFALERNLSNAFKDELTELPNERAFFMVLENQLAESTRFRGERPITVLSIDLKNFHLINEKFGHSTGDRVLIEAANRIRGEMRRMDFLARIDGDEFLLALPLADEKPANEVVSRIKESITSTKVTIGEVEIPIYLNIGSATYWKDGESAQQLVQ
ncbi:MAG: sensor domain-containing diguanylate cyclase, partial [Pyrinomonadaceae bacterium]